MDGISKDEWVKDFGADYVIDDYGKVTEKANEFTQGKMVDVVLNSLGVGTPSPICLTTPEKSIPNVDGNRSGIICCIKPSAIFQSVGFTPAAFTITRTFPADTIGSGTLWLISTTSSLFPYFLIRADLNAYLRVK